MNEEFLCHCKQQLSDNLKTSPDTLENLKFILGTIADIRNMSLRVEMRYIDIQERYRTLAMYNIQVSSSVSHLAMKKQDTRPVKSRGFIYLPGSGG